MHTSYNIWEDKMQDKTLSMILNIIFYVLVRDQTLTQQLNSTMILVISDLPANSYAFHLALN